MHQALYGPDGFFIRDRPARHFRTSAHSPLFARAVDRLIERADNALGRPPRLDIVDVGAGGGELLANLTRDERYRFTAVEYGQEVPEVRDGVILATELLDNIPLDIAENGRYLHDGAALSEQDAAWVARWWDAPYVEIGRARDEAWAHIVSKLHRGVALAVDYGHLAGMRPATPTVAGFRDGLEVEPLLDGSTDVTVHVAMDSVAEASGVAYRLMRQREALQELGVDGARPPLELARQDPVAYLRRLSEASEAADLTNPHGLGSHWWLLQTVGCQL